MSTIPIKSCYSIKHTEERVLPAEVTHCGDHDGLTAVEAVYLKVGLNLIHTREVV